MITDQRLRRAWAILIGLTVMAITVGVLTMVIHDRIRLASEPAEVIALLPVLCQASHSDAAGAFKVLLADVRGNLMSAAEQVTPPASNSMARLEVWTHFPTYWPTGPVSG